MKRHSARITVIERRNRTANEADQSRLPLSPEEIEEIRQAYRDGCGGEIMIGFRGTTRVVTMLLPIRRNRDRVGEQVEQVAERLRAMGCDGCVHMHQ